MLSLEDIHAVPKQAFHAPAANVDAIIDIPADPDQFWVIDTIAANYDVAPNAGGVEFGGFVPPGGFAIGWLIGIEIIGTELLFFKHGLLTGIKNQIIRVLFEAGGVGVKGTLAITYR